MKKQNSYMLSSAVLSFLFFSPALALPSGGKFTHDTSGSITINNGTMNITGGGKNSVIQWGGGFSINQGETVNFNGPNKNYLNIVHGAKKSIIDGTLNGGGNNVFLINANGVLITKNGQVNANRFVASTSSIKNEDMTKFANMQKFEDGLSFSPVFKPNKLGNVVNMGNINAKDILIISNKFDNKQGQITSNKLHLVGNEIYLDVEKTNSKDLYLSAYEKAVLMQNGSSFYNQDKLSDFNYNLINYNGESFNNKIIKNYSISNINDWFYFAKGWDENKNNMRSVIDLFSLENDIDFGGKNYLKYCLNDFGCYNLVIGKDDASAFNKAFSGNNFTLKNMKFSDNGFENENVDWTYSTHYSGIFGLAENASFSDVNVDFNFNKIDVYMNGVKNGFVGGFIAKSKNSDFSNISLKNIFELRTAWIAGGFIASDLGSNFSNIELSNIIAKDGKNGGIYSNFQYAGGFAGKLENSNLNNIILNNINSVIAETYVGGFVGYANNAKFNNIILNDLGSIFAVTYAGYNPLDPYKSSGISGGFAGKLENSNLSNIYMYFKDFSTLQGTTTGRFVGENIAGSFDNINLYNARLTANSEDRLYCIMSNGAFCKAIENSWNDSEKNLNIKDVIYTDNVKAKEDFIALIDERLENVDFDNGNFEIEKPQFTEDIKLGEDDLYISTIKDILEELVFAGYEIQVSLIDEMMKVYINSEHFQNMTREDKIDFVARYLLRHIDRVNGILNVEQAEKIVDSLGFFYTLSFDDEKISANAKDSYEFIKFSIEEAFDNKNNAFSFVGNELGGLISSGQGLNNEIIKIQNELNGKIEQYNKLVEIINNPLLSADARELLKNKINTLKNDIDILVERSKEICIMVNQYRMALAKIKGLRIANHFAIKGDINKISLNPVKLAMINPINPEIPEAILPPIIPEKPIIKPQEPILPPVVVIPEQPTNEQESEEEMDFVFSSTSAYSGKRGDDAMKKQNSNKEISETALKQGVKTCITSDNYKTLVPCIAGSI